SDGQGGYISPPGVHDKVTFFEGTFSVSHGDDSCGCPPGDSGPVTRIVNPLDLKQPPRPRDQAEQNFDSLGRLQTITDPAGLSWSLTYNPS
ncbi:MAG: hypothetical protein GTO61_11460, partial [Gemmatimonadales bacterium]|nr:hypothetical protein [Gemmatimonadales bacterium]